MFSAWMVTNIKFRSNIPLHPEIDVIQQSAQASIRFPYKFGIGTSISVCIPEEIRAIRIHSLTVAARLILVLSY